MYDGCVLKYYCITSSATRENNCKRLIFSIIPKPIVSGEFSLRQPFGNVHICKYKLFFMPENVQWV